MGQVVDIDKMQYGFIPERGTVGFVFVLRRFTEKFIAKNKKLFLLFIDMEKAFHGVLREVNPFVLRPNGVQEYFVDGVISLYKDCKTSVLVDGELSSSFPVKIGVHQESALNPLLLVRVIDVWIEDVSDGLLMELLY